MAQRIELITVDGTAQAEDASVRLSVPAHRDYVSVVRSAVAQLSACVGFTLGEVGDLRLAVDEACNLLIAGSESRSGSGSAASGLECRADSHGDLMHVTMAAPAVTARPPDTDGFGWNILTALVDTLAWEQDDDTVRVELEKRHSGRCA